MFKPALLDKYTVTPTHLLAFLAAALALLMAWHGPILQWADYHAFADGRAWDDLPNAANVLSNLPFACIGLWGCWRLRRRAGVDTPSRAAWWMFSASVACTAVGSALYHWQPDDSRLVADRLPIAWACASLMCGFLADRVDARWARPPALIGAWVISALSVAWWWASVQQSQGDLRPYLFVQFLPMLLVPAALWMKLPTRSAQAIPASCWWSVLALYALAKLVESADHALLDALGLISGHTLKHLLAAAAAGMVLRAACKRPHTEAADGS